MSNDPTEGRILLLCKQLHALTCDQEARTVAIGRNWLDSDGEPTAEGREVIESLKDVRQTRNSMPQVH